MNLNNIDNYSGDNSCDDLGNDSCDDSNTDNSDTNDDELIDDPDDKNELIDNPDAHVKITLNQWNNMPYKEFAKKRLRHWIIDKCHQSNTSTTIADNAMIAYDNITKNKIYRGSARTGIIAACYYTACNTNNITRSHSDIAELFDIPTYKLKNCVNLVEHNDP